MTPGEPERDDGRDDPVIVSGVGGSGTSTVAALLRDCGLRLAGPTNAELDQEWVTMLIKRPRWPALVHEAGRPVEDVVAACRVLRAMFAGSVLDGEQLAILAAAAAECAALGATEHDGLRWWAPATPFRFVADYLARPPAPLGTQAWGWTSPSSQVVLPETLAVFPAARYVHVVRDPLDMAWSANMQGVRLWGRLCGYDAARIDADPHSAQLAWWLYTTLSAVQIGRTLGDRFLLVRLELLCRHPIGVARRIAAFAGLEPDSETLRAAAARIQAPPSTGRWREHPTEELDPALLRQARRWTTNWSRADAEAQSPDPR